VAYSLSPGKGAAPASAPLASFAGSPKAGSYADRPPPLVKARLRARRLGLGCLNHNLLIFIKHFESHRDVFTLKLTPKEENNNLINMLY
jgi:hypothetical protein